MRRVILSLALLAGCGDDAAKTAPPADAGAAEAAAPRPECIDDLGAGQHAYACDGITYDVTISAECANGGCGLIVDFPGLSMKGEQENSSTKLRELASGRSYVVVQPTAPSSVVGPVWVPRRDDAPVWTFVNDLAAALRTDPKRLHLTGFSQGGAMAYRLMCAHADAIASVAPASSSDGESIGAVSPPYQMDCPYDATRAPSVPVPVLQMHGTKDGTVPFEKATQQRDVALAWLGKQSESIVSADANYKHTRYETAKGAVYEFIQHDYLATEPLVPIPGGVDVAGHCMPGGDDLRGQATGHAFFFTCAPPTAFKWGALMVDFFLAHPKN
jgi:pimeloyl-ACP methyl ester carboxylesterase